MQPGLPGCHHGGAGPVFILPSFYFVIIFEDNSPDETLHSGDVGFFCVVVSPKEPTPPPVSSPPAEKVSDDTHTLLL